MDTKTSSDLKQIVKEHYTEIVEQSEQKAASSCCGSACGCSSEVDVMVEDYSNVKGYVKEADLALGCGIPTEVADIKPGDTVLDLGSGAGNDCFVARSIVGDNGRVIGIDMTEKMIAKANMNNAKLGFKNVEFVLGDIESMPIESNTADVVVSNCVLNLVPDKRKAFAEMFRVIKSGGHFTVSDIVLEGSLPAALKEVAVMYAGCVSGAIQKNEYLALLREAGFRNVKVVKSRSTNLPDDMLLQYVSPKVLQEYKDSGAGIFSVTVYGEKS
jgi:ubiquinone/menaquinone biosynthesis C-methylase UbiE